MTLALLSGIVMLTEHLERVLTEEATCRGTTVVI